MHDYVYLLVLQAKQPFGLYDLQPFVHKGGAVNGYLGPHSPVRMLQRVRGFYVHQVIRFTAQEWSTRGGKYYLLYLVRVFSNQALEDGRVFTINRYDM